MDEKDYPYLDSLKAIGANVTKYQYDKPDSSLLECFSAPSSPHRPKPGAPWYENRLSIRIVCPEFTSLCPVTGQPDFATIIITYTPDSWCVESKSLKLYLMGFRNFGEFHESCVVRIAKDLIEVMNPLKLVVEGQFTPRGGIPFWPKYEFNRAINGPAIDLS